MYLASDPNTQHTIEDPKSRKLLLILLVTGLLVTPLLLALRERESVCGRVTTANRMKQWGLIFAMYSNESAGEKLPPLAVLPNRWVPDLETVYPEYLADPILLVGREHPEAGKLMGLAEAALKEPLLDYDFAAKVMAESFAYLNYVVTNEAEVQALVDARRGGALVDAIGAAPSTEPQFFATRNRPGCTFIVRPEHFQYTGYPPIAASAVPVLIDVGAWKRRKDRSRFRGSYVLFQDGHVEFVPLGTFPVLPGVLDALSGEEWERGPDS